MNGYDLLVRQKKRNKSFRLDPELATLTEATARISGLSEAEVIARCVLAQVQVVLKSHKIQQAALQSESVARELGAALTIWKKGQLR